MTTKILGEGIEFPDSSVQVKAATEYGFAAQTDLAALDAALDFTIIYPNGGTEASPANVAINSGYVEENPFAGNYVICKAQIQDAGRWWTPGWAPSAATLQCWGVHAEFDGTQLRVSTGISGLATKSTVAGGTYTGSDITTPRPCRVLVWKVKGAV